MKKILVILGLIICMLIPLAFMNLSIVEAKSTEINITPEIDIIVRNKLYLPQEYKNGNNYLVHPLSYDNRVYLPIEYVAQMLRLGVVYDSLNNSIYFSSYDCTRKNVNIDYIKDVYYTDKIKIFIDNNKINFHNNDIRYVSIIYNEKIYVSIRHLSEASGHKVFWNNEKRQIIIEK